MNIFQEWKADVLCVFERDPAARNVFEVITTYPGVHAMIFYRLNHRLWNMGVKYIARWLSGFARWWTGIEIHPGAKIGKHFFIDHGMGIVIGETTEVGDECTIYQGVTLGGTSWSEGKRHPTLHNGVIVGAGAKILGPIEIGENARVGSNAVVVKPVPDNVTVIGVPGRLVSAKKDLVKQSGFEAYGISMDTPDPQAEAFSAMVDHLKLIDEKLVEFNQILKDNKLPLIDLGELPNLQKLKTEKESSEDA